MFFGITLYYVIIQYKVKRKQRSFVLFNKEYDGKNIVTQKYKVNEMYDHIIIY